jgi:hypothetical protein
MSDREVKTAGPAVCPYCDAKQTGDDAKSTNETTYRRCETCGEVWNPKRPGSQQPKRQWWR